MLELRALSLFLCQFYYELANFSDLFTESAFDFIGFSLLFTRGTVTDGFLSTYLTSPMPSLPQSPERLGCTCLISTFGDAVEKGPELHRGCLLYTSDAADEPNVV